MKRILFIDFHNFSPHIETSFELAKRHLDEGDQVKFFFLGHNVPYREHLVSFKLKTPLFHRWLPEGRAARLIRHPNFEFTGDVKLPIDVSAVRMPQTLEELKAVTYRGADIGMGVASSIISRTRNSLVDPTQHQEMIRNALAGCIAVYDYSHYLLESYHQDILYIFNGRLCYPRAVLRAAEHLQVRARIHERGADMTKFVVRDFTPHNRKKVQEDVVSTWSGVAGSASSVATAERWFAERRAGQPRDWHSFTASQGHGLLPPVDSGKKIVTYFSSSDDEFAAIGDEFLWEGWRDQIDAVEGLVRAMRGRDDSQLIIRIHPHLTQKHPDDLARWLDVGRDDPGVIVIEPGSPIDSYALLDASDVVVSGGSTIGLEAVYWGKPSILLGPSDYDQLGAVHLAHTEVMLKELLSKERLSSNQETALPYAYYRATFGEEFRYFEPSGLSGGRFLGEDVHRLPLVPRLANQLRHLVLGSTRPRSV